MHQRNLPIPLEYFSTNPYGNIIHKRFQEDCKRFNTVWNFPNCIGALDAKHIRIKCPTILITRDIFPLFYRDWYMIIINLYRSILVGVGRKWWRNFEGSSLGQMMEKNKLNIPAETCLPGTYVRVPVSFRAEETFNKRMSWARKTVECALGILFSKLRILGGCIETGDKFADDIVNAICILYNIIIDIERYILKLSALPPIPQLSTYLSVMFLFINYQVKQSI